MHGIDLTRIVHFYPDASSYAAGLAVTQFIPTEEADVSIKMTTKGLPKRIRLKS